MSEINIGKDFSVYPAGRYKTDGKASGERFREDFLIPALISGEIIIIHMDDTRGYDSSFLEEAFGGIFRIQKTLEFETVNSRVKLISDDQFLINEVIGYMKDASRRNL